MPIVLIEGCDGTGKSTLAEMIVEHAQRSTPCKVRLEHYGVPTYDPESPLTIGQQAMNQLLERLLDFDFREDFVVLDRFHWGEPVYAPVFRRDRCVDPLFGTLTYDEFYYVQNWLESVGAVTVYCTAPKETILDRVLGRGEEDLIADSGDAEERTIQILERYENLKTYITHENRRSPAKVEVFELLRQRDSIHAMALAVDMAMTNSSKLMSEYLSNTAYWKSIDISRNGTDHIAEQLKPHLMKAAT